MPIPFRAGALSPAHASVPLAQQTGAATARNPRHVARVLLVLAFASVVVARLPSVFTLGRFWAEEGSVYFLNAWNQTWLDALFAVHTGYINLSASLATLMAARLVPLAQAPLVSAGFALAVQVCPAILLATSGIVWMRRWTVLTAALLLVALQPNAAEIWLNSITSQFHLGLCAALILAMPTRGGAVGGFRLALLLLGGLSGPASAFTAPLFWLRAALDRSPARALQAALLSAAVAVEALMVWLHPDPGRPFGIDPPVLLLVIFEKQFLVPFLGLQPAIRIAAQLQQAVPTGEVLWIGLLVAAAALLTLLAVVRSRDQATAWLFAAGIAIMTLSYFGAYDDHRALLNVLFGMRYAYVPCVLFGLTLLGCAATLPGRERILPGVLVVWLLFVGIKGFRDADDFFRRGPAWSAEIARWRADPTYRVRFWPALDSWRASLGPARGGL